MQFVDWDNGVYEVDLKTLTIIGRKYFKGVEQNQYPLEETVKEILSKVNMKE